MSIEYVFNDIDGCIDNFAKPDFPDKQDLSPYFQGLQRIREISKQLPETNFGVATARSVHECDNIIHALDFQGPLHLRVRQHRLLPRRGGDTSSSATWS